METVLSLSLSLSLNDAPLNLCRGVEVNKKPTEAIFNQKKCAEAEKEASSFRECLVFYLSISLSLFLYRALSSSSPHSLQSLKRS